MKCEYKAGMIVDLLDNVLMNNNFQRLLEIEEKSAIDWNYEWHLYGSDNQQKEQYLILVNIVDSGKVMLEKIIGQQSDIYIKLKKRLKANFDKNVSMLICVRTEEDEKKEYETIVLEVEEDCYYFKKLVMIYRDDEVAEVKETLENRQLNMWQYMREKLYEIAEIKDDNAFFAELERIVPRIYIKLPFIQLEVQGDKKKRNLFEEIKKSMKKEDILLSIWNQVEKMKEDEIKELELKNDKTLDEMLKQWLPEEK